MPGGFVCSGSFKAKLPEPHVRAAVAGGQADPEAVHQGAAGLLRSQVPSVEIDDLSVLGPITVFKLKFRPKELAGRKMVAELWNYPDGSRIVELSTKCAPGETFQVAAETRAFLFERGVELTGEQQTKTRTALEFFANELKGEAP